MVIHFTQTKLQICISNAISLFILWEIGKKIFNVRLRSIRNQCLYSQNLSCYEGGAIFFLRFQLAVIFYNNQLLTAIELYGLCCVAVIRLQCGAKMARHHFRVEEKLECCDFIFTNRGNFQGKINCVAVILNIYYTSGS